MSIRPLFARLPHNNLATIIPRRKLKAHGPRDPWACCHFIRARSISLLPPRKEGEVRPLRRHLAEHRVELQRDMAAVRRDRGLGREADARVQIGGNGALLDYLLQPLAQLFQEWTVRGLAMSHAGDPAAEAIAVHPDRDRAGQTAELLLD